MTLGEVAYLAFQRYQGIKNPQFSRLTDANKAAWEAAAQAVRAVPLVNVGAGAVATFGNLDIITPGQP